jgi:PAS domain S-box-containing protein
MDAKPLRTLLVEDNPGDARLIREMLSEVKDGEFELINADRLAAAIDLAERDSIDVVLLDLSLPDSHGLDTFLQLHVKVPHLPVIVLTGLDDEAIAVRAAHEGAQDYLVKGEAEGKQLARSIRYAVERKQIERQLRESEQRLRTVVTTAPIVLYATDPNGVITLCQGRGLAALGLTSADLEGLSLTQAFPELPQLAESIRRAMAGETLQGNLDMRGATYQTFTMPLRDSHEDVCGIIGVATDVTDLTRAQRELQQTVAVLQDKTAELESFSYSVSHDLKEPLRTLEAFSQFLLEDHAANLDAQGIDYLTRIMKASARLKNMLDELLLLTRIGRRPELLEQIGVGQIVADILSTAQLALSEKHATVNVVGELPHVLGDAAHIEQIFGNLISNALKFNESEQPAIEIGLQEENERSVTFYVRDNGIGIDPEHHDHIFGVFKRLHRREQYDGTGAGLAIVKRAAEALEGRVWLESQLGSGATFYVTLPRWRAAAAPLAEAAG